MAWKPTDDSENHQAVEQLLAGSSIAREDGTIDYALLRTQTIYCTQSAAFLQTEEIALLLTAVLQAAYPKTRLSTLQQVVIEPTPEGAAVQMQACCHLTNKAVRLLLGGIETLRINVQLPVTVDDDGVVHIADIHVDSPDVKCREYMLQLGCRIVFGTEDYQTFVKEFVSQTLLHLGRVGLPDCLGSAGIADRGVHFVLYPAPPDSHAFAPQSAGWQI